MTIDTIDTIKIRTYSGMIALLYFFYILTFFGIYSVNPKYIHILSIIIQLFICLFLMWSFNPYIKQELRIYDGQIIFAAAFFLLNNVVVTELISLFHIPIQKYTNSIKTTIFGKQSIANTPTSNTFPTSNTPTSNTPTSNTPTSNTFPTSNPHLASNA